MWIKIYNAENLKEGEYDLVPKDEIKQLKDLLKVARCPNTSCQDGAIPTGRDSDGEWEAEQCQWCYEKEQALKG